LAYTRREPVGVVAAIVPWNFPLMILSWKLAPALAAGNTVIIKPASYTPLSALRLVELAEEVGFPSGVINIVTGPGSTVGMALAEHKGVNKVSFTGSTETGREIMRAAAGNFKRLSLELGGKTANIIFPDADMGMAVGGAFMGIFMNQGEVCVAGSRLFVPKAHFDEVISALTERASEINQGPGVDPTVTMGPLISKSHMDRVMSYIEKGKAEGAELVLGGETNPAAGPGYFVKPTIFVGRDDMTIAREEIFGPVLTALPFEDIDDVVRRANASPYGLGAAVWTKDVAKGIEVAHRLEAGSVWVNGFGIMDSSGAWGGFKESGMGREMGRYAMEAFTEVKFVGVNLG
jgi:aldehyde dehydrogenase (NAD+)/phenylacetaldehyde dehydrogenase